MIPVPLPLPRSLPPEPMSEWSAAYLLALRERLRLHVAWIGLGGTDDPDDPVGPCAGCDPEQVAQP